MLVASCPQQEVGVLSPHPDESDSVACQRASTKAATSSAMGVTPTPARADGFRVSDEPRPEVSRVTSKATPVDRRRNQNLENDLRPHPPHLGTRETILHRRPLRRAGFELAQMSASVNRCSSTHLIYGTSGHKSRGSEKESPDERFLTRIRRDSKPPRPKDGVGAETAHRRKSLYHSGK